MNNRTVNVSPEPKKSARLAEKRKLREEAGTGPNSAADSDYCFTQYSYGKLGIPQTKNSIKNTTPPQASPVISPKLDPAKSKTRIGSPVNVKNSTGKSPQKGPSSTQAKLVTNSSSEVDELEHESNTNLKSALSIVNSNKKKNTVSPSSSKVVVIDDDEQGSLDEEKWLDALEAGKLEELDTELKQIKNPKALTARQKAISEKRDKDFGFIEDQSSGHVGKDILTPEMIQLKARKTEQRKLLAQAKKVEDQKKTVEKLLNKPYSKGARTSNKNKGIKKHNGPVISYIDRPDKKIIVFPPGMEIPILKASKPLRLPNKIICAVSGCSNLKKYVCAQTLLPACSFECYKKNKDDYLVSDIQD